MAKFVNRDSLAASIALEQNLTAQEAAAIVNQVFEEMSQALETGGVVDIHGFGKFVIFNRKSRMGINPVTKERMEIPATKLPKYKPSQTLKRRCNSGADLEDNSDDIIE